MNNTVSNLWEKVTYLAPIDYCVNRIYEYDIRQANITMLSQSGYLPKSEISRLAKMPKLDREKSVGLMIRKDRHIYDIIKSGIEQAKRELFEANGIEDSDVLSIKNDAVFVLGRKLKHIQFGIVEFVLKNEFNVYHHINKLEFYYNTKTDAIAVKGLSDEVVEHEDHKQGMLMFLSKVFSYLSLGRTSDLKKYLVKFSTLYKKRELPVYYYREMNGDNLYRLSGDIIVKDDNSSRMYLHLDVAGEEIIDNINITYNYLYYVLPIMRIHL